MSAKSEAVAKILAKIQPTWQPPTPLEGAPLVENALLCVLVRTLSQAQAEATIKSLKQAAGDWNELRVCQPQELQPLIATKDAARSLRAARDVRECLQEIFQWSHGYDLESLKEDWVAAGKFVTYLSFHGHRISHFLMWLAADKKTLPISAALVRMVDRLGVGERIGSLKKSRAPIENLAGGSKEVGAKEQDFLLRMSEVIDRWCHAQKPLCHQCPLVDDCVFGRKAFKEWKVQQVRMEQYRKKEEQRREILRKKEEEREKKLAEREKKRREAEQAKAERERARMQREEQRRKAIESKEKARVDEIQRRKAAAEAARVEKERQRKAAIEQKRKQAEQRKRDEEARKMAAAKAKAAAQLKQKAAAQKAAEQKRKEAERKAAERKKAAAAKAKKSSKTRRR
ncbi:MAG: hypothetical protein FJ299_07810 [Planctomycetes bacterium]|nr:hypothetical protein [Planctomycetota bacterium]